VSREAFEKPDLTPEIQTIAVSNDGRFHVPEARLLFDAQFERSGSDLFLINDDFAILHVADYFKDGQPADIYAPDGAVLRGDVIAQLTGPLAPGQYAQTGPQIGTQPIGQVETLSGSATAQHSDGIVETLQVGMKIYQNDVIQTEANGVMSVTFVDGTIFTLASGSRMIIDELIYDPEGSSNTGSFNLIQGGFVFIAGQVAKTGEMDVNTPSTTMGIRGTTVLVDIQTENGVVTSEVTLTRDPDEGVGEVVLRGLDGQVIATITETDSKWIISRGGEVRQEARTALDDADDNVLIAEAFAAYHSAFARVDNGDTFVTIGDNSNYSGPGSPSNPNDTDLQLDSIDEPNNIDPNNPDPLPEQQNDGGVYEEGRLNGTGEVIAVDVTLAGVEDSSVTGAISGVIQPNAPGDTVAVFELGTGPANGSALVDPDGSFNYVPDVNFNGEDSFTYNVTDGQGNVETGTVTIQVSSVNDAPALDDSEASVAEDGTVSGTVVGTDIDGDSLRYTLETGANFGQVVLLQSGAFTYFPDPDYNGSDSFEVKVSDPSGASAIAAVSIAVAAVNDAPEVSSPSGEAAAVVHENSAIDTAGGTLQATDADLGSILTWSGSTHGDFGSFEISETGVWVFTLDENAADSLSESERATDVFLATVTDDQGATDEQVITVTIEGANDAALIDGDATGQVTEDAILITATGDLDHTDVDASNDADKFQAKPAGTASDQGYGSYEVTAAGVWLYTLNNDHPVVTALSPGEALNDSFIVLAEDGTEQMVSVTIDGSNDAALITGDITGHVTEDAALITASGDLTHTDVDAGNDADKFQTQSAGTASDQGYGSYEVTATGLWTYTLNNDHPAVMALTPDQTLTDGFTVLAEDGTEQQVTVTIGGTNDAALITGDITGQVTEDATVITATGDLDHTDIDANNDADNFQASPAGTASNNGYGSFEVTALGRWTYTLDNDHPVVTALNPGETLSDSFSVFAEDGTEQLVTLEIEGANDAPVITSAPDAATGTVTEGAEIATVVGELIAHDPDAGAVVTWSGSTSGIYGAFVIAADGTWTYTLDNVAADVLSVGQIAVEVFTASVTDNLGATQEQNVSINVIGTNDLPIVQRQIIVEVVQNQAYEGTLTATDVDSIGLLAFSNGAIGPQHGDLNIDPDGTYIYTPDEGFQGLDNFDILVEDSDGGISTGHVTVEIESETGAGAAGQAVTLDINTEITPDAPAGSILIEASSVDVSSVNLVIAMDRSGSIGNAGWATQTEAVASALELLASQFADSSTSVDVKIITYATGVQVLETIDLQDPTLSSTVRELPFTGGTTNWGLALNETENFLDTQPTNEANFLFFITDGNPTSGEWQTALADLKDTNANGYSVNIEAFGIGDGYNVETLALIDPSPTLLVGADDLAQALTETPIFDPRLIGFELSLEVDGVDLGIIADENSPALQNDGLNYELSLADIVDIETLLGENNRFSATVQFDLDGDESTAEIELFSTELLSISETLQTLSGLDENDLLLGSNENDQISGNGGNDVLMGFGGNDVLSGGMGVNALMGGAGDDILSQGERPTGSGGLVDGGDGRDILALEFAGDIDGDLFSLLSVTNIEAIDMENALGNTLNLTLSDVMDLSDTGDADLEALLGEALSESAVIYGDDADTLVLSNGPDGGFEQVSGDPVVDSSGHSLVIFQYIEGGNVLATLGVDDDVETTIVTAV
jgi:VCBS repeat-containing protein